MKIRLRLNFVRDVTLKIFVQVKLVKRNFFFHRLMRNRLHCVNLRLKVMTIRNKFAKTDEACKKKHRKQQQ